MCNLGVTFLFAILLFTFKDFAIFLSSPRRPSTRFTSDRKHRDFFFFNRANYKCCFHLLPSRLQTKALFIVSMGYSQPNSIN